MTNSLIKLWIALLMYAGSLELQSQNRQADSLHLVDLYNTTLGMQWDSTWDLLQSMDHWYGITLDDDGRVRKVFLNNNNMQGTLPSSITQLDQLRLLILRSNEIAGTIPANIGDLSKLTFIDLGDNHFTGNIPASFNQLEDLTNFQLYRNQLSGTMPADLSQLTKLTTVLLSNNQLTGTIPSYVYDWLKLKSLNLSGNDLSGEISPMIKNLVNVETFIVGSNQISGVLPKEFGMLPKLERLEVHRNQMSGVVPEEIGQATSLQRLNLSYNQFTELPQSIDQLVNLTGLLVTGNLLQTLPDLSHLDQWKTGGLDGLVVNWNQLTFKDIERNLPLESAGFKFVYHPQSELKLQPVGIVQSGQPLVLKTELQEPLEGTKFHWYFEDEFITTTDSNQFTISSVNIAHVGSYHCEMTNPAMPKLRLTTNSYGLEIDRRKNDSLALVGIYHAMNGPQWDQQWDFSQPINTWRGVAVEYGRVYQLSLSYNNVAGTLPAITKNLNALEIVNLSGNPIDSIPSVLKSLPYLNTLVLNDAGLHGAVPPWLFDLERLSILRLRDNDLDGVIPAELAQLQDLFFLELGGNQFTGIVPDIWDSLPEISTLDLSLSEIDMPLPPSLYRLPNLARLSLNTVPIGNSLDPGLANLASLTRLSLEETNLSVLPSWFDQLTLSYINLDKNRFRNFPKGLLSMPSLQAIHLTDNGMQSLPFEGWDAMQQLHTLFLSKNELTSLPNLENLSSWSTTTATGGLRVDRNYLTFEDLAAHSYLFSPDYPFNLYDRQSTIQIDQRDAEVPRGASFKYTCTIDSSVSNVTYQWTKNGDTINQLSTQDLLLKPFIQNDTGRYHCVLTHPSWPKLQLETSPFYLSYVITTSSPFTDELAPFKVFPNPIVGAQIHIESPNVGRVQITLMDILGNEVFRQYSDQSHDMIFQLPFEIPKGKYLLQLKSDHVLAYTVKLVK